MDAHYNFEKARDALGKIIENNKASKAHQLLQFDKTDPPQIHAFNQPKSWRMLDDSDTTELAFRVQGILVHKELPPFTKHFGRNSSKVTHLSQTIHLSGLGCPAFERVNNTIIDIHELFSRKFQEDKLYPPVPSHFMQFSKIEASTRYFSHRRSNPNGDSIPFSSDVDPQGLLSAHVGSDLYHGIDNQVQYFAIEQNGKESSSYKRVSPTVFRVGDIIEAQLLFVAIPVRNDKIKLITQFQSVALLDSSFSKDAYYNRIKAPTHPGCPMSIPKRKIGYECEEQDPGMTTATRKMRRLSLEDRPEEKRHSGDMDTVA